MANISNDTLASLALALTSSAKANEVVDALNKANAQWEQVSKLIGAVIVATATSTTTDFGALEVGDILIHIPATPGNAGFETVVTAGIKPSSAVIGDLYIALRTASAPAAANNIP